MPAFPLAHELSLLVLAVVAVEDSLPSRSYMRTCTITGCQKEFVARGWCMHHYDNWRHRGDPLCESTIRGVPPKCYVENGIGHIPVTRGKVALVDADMLPELSQYIWTTIHGGRDIWYAIRHSTANGKRIHVRMHSHILAVPPGRVVDHINHNGLDNRKENLRIATHKQNCANRRPRRKVFKGVYKGSLNRWVAVIMVNGHNEFLGSFMTPYDAAVAFNIAAQLFQGEYAYLNPV